MTRWQHSDSVELIINRLCLCLWSDVVVLKVDLALRLGKSIAIDTVLPRLLCVNSNSSDGDLIG